MPIAKFHIENDGIMRLKEVKIFKCVALKPKTRRVSPRNTCVALAKFFFPPPRHQAEDETRRHQQMKPGGPTWPAAAAVARGGFFIFIFFKNVFYRNIFSVSYFKVLYSYRPVGGGPIAR